jgi:hypothetical protein
MRFSYFYLMSDARLACKRSRQSMRSTGVNSGYLTIWVDPSGTDQED